VQLKQFEARLPCALPQHVRELLKFARGFEGSAVDLVDFTGRHAYGHYEIFPHGLTIAGDGFGNFWVVDLSASSADFGPIYYACHDPPVIVLQSHSLSGFLNDLIRVSPEDSPIDFVHEEAAMSIWEDDPHAVTREEALLSADSELREFASAAPAGCLIADLRRAEPGGGFCWGKFGPDTQILRHPDAPMFAYGPHA
jgi:hypothetical protein